MARTYPTAKRLKQVFWRRLRNALEQSSFASRIQPADAFVQLVGTPHPSPSKAEQFRRVDLASARASVAAAAEAKIRKSTWVNSQ